jgi:AbrB family looped-hinge helix DNA binding protein
MAPGFRSAILRKNVCTVTAHGREPKQRINASRPVNTPPYFFTLASETPQQPSGFAIIYPMKITIVTISSKGQFTIPKALRERLGIQLGDRVEVWVEHGSMRAKPVKPVPKRPRIS